MLQAHYTSILDLSNDALLASEKGYYRLMEAYASLDSLETGKAGSFDYKTWEQNCYQAMNDDFNTPILIAHLFDATKQINLIKDGTETISKEDKEFLKTTLDNFIFDVLGLESPTANEGKSDTLSGVVQLLIELRNKARANKDFATSDQIRDELIALGIQLKDGKDGTTFSTN